MGGYNPFNPITAIVGATYPKDSKCIMFLFNCFHISISISILYKLVLLNFKIIKH